MSALAERRRKIDNHLRRTIVTLAESNDGKVIADKMQRALYLAKEREAVDERLLLVKLLNA